MALRPTMGDLSARSYPHPPLRAIRNNPRLARLATTLAGGTWGDRNHKWPSSIWLGAPRRRTCRR
eukprot:8299225-Pyramimonas_sp.AAC.1